MTPVGWGVHLDRAALECAQTGMNRLQYAYDKDEALSAVDETTWLSLKTISFQQSGRPCDTWTSEAHCETSPLITGKSGGMNCILENGVSN